MTSKANSLEDIVNMFKPRALTEEQSEFYQKTSAVRSGDMYEFHADLFERIKISDVHERLLVVGHMGCGKSTELSMLKKKLSNDNFAAIHIEIFDKLDLNNFNYIDIFMLIVEEVVQYAKEHNLNVDNTLISIFEKAISTQITSEFVTKEANANAEAAISASTPRILSFLSMVAKINTSLKLGSGRKEVFHRELQPKISEMIASLNGFIEHISELSNRKVVIILDGLEKCRHERVFAFFVEDITTILSIKAHLVLACPIAVYRSVGGSVLSSYFPAPGMIPMIKTHYQDGSLYPEGIEVIKELILKRADVSFFEENILETIIEKAGGSLRDTFNLLSNSAFEAIMRRRNTIDMSSTEVALKRFATDVFFRVEPKLYPKVKEIYYGNHMASSDHELSELLYSGAVFEYINGEPWVNLHPLFREYLKKKPEVLSD